MSFVRKAFPSANKVSVQGAEVRRTHVGKLYPFEVVPDALVGIEIMSVTG